MKTNEQEESVVSRPGIDARGIFTLGYLMLNPEQVDLSNIFPKPNTTEGPLGGPTLRFLSGEKRQAICTSTLIPPVEVVKKINGVYNHTQLRNYLYVPSYPHNTTNSHSQDPNIL